MAKKSDYLHTSLDEEQGIADYSYVKTCEQHHLWAHDKHTSDSTTGCASHQRRDRYLVCTRPTEYAIDSPSKRLIEACSGVRPGYTTGSHVTHLGETHSVGSKLRVSVESYQHDCILA